jgi:tyrosine-protein phosphatase SIW14
MRTIISTCLAVILWVIPSPVRGETTPKETERTTPAAPIKRFAEVTPRLYRGAQPSAAGFAYLYDRGVRTVISLLDNTAERAKVESLGMRYVNIPVTFRPFVWGDDVTDAALEQFFQVVDDPASGIVFVHCHRGADRTGTFVGLYRMARQGWDLQRAYNEARQVGMRWWYYPIKDRMAQLASALRPAATTAQ